MNARAFLVMMSGLVASIVAVPAAAQTFPGTLEESDPRFLPPASSLTRCQAGGGNVPTAYDAIAFSPPVTGRYTVSVSNPSDAVSLLVYASTFAPGDPLTNCIASNGGKLPGALRQVQRVFEVGTSYVLVPFATSPTEAPTQSYVVTVSGPLQAPLDFSGDGRGDLATIRTTGGMMTWWILDQVSSAVSQAHWGATGDVPVPGDYDGDLRTDAAIWRPGAAGSAGFWIKRSSNGAVVFLPLGQSGDDPTIVGDYDGDGKTDIAVHRAGASSGLPNNWIYRQSSDGALVMRSWGAFGEIPAPGDYDGDGKADLAFRRNPTALSEFWLNQSRAGIWTVYWGEALDKIVPADLDADGKTDVGAIRTINGALRWFFMMSAHANGVWIGPTFGVASTDVIAPGDYFLDSRAEIAVWRDGIFWMINPNGLSHRYWGMPGDYPAANYNVR
jgi:FG-GAP-like repeat